MTFIIKGNKKKPSRIEPMITLEEMVYEGVDCDGVHCIDCPFHLRWAVKLGDSGDSACIAVIIKYITEHES